MTCREHFCCAGPIARQCRGARGLVIVSLFFYWGSVTLRCFGTLSKVALGLLLALPLAACERPSDVTAKPPESSEPASTDVLPAAIYVSAPVDLTKTEDEIVRLLPGDISALLRRVPKAFCKMVPVSAGSAATKQVCLDVRLWGRISRDGQAKLTGTAQGLDLKIPLRYELMAQPVGVGPVTPVTGTISVTASYGLTMDERWQPTLKLGQGFTWPDGAKIKVLESETSVQAEVEQVLIRALSKMKPGPVPGIVPDSLRPQVELTWRYLHYPIALSQDHQIWMRGTPVGLRFAGLAQGTGGVELRVAIAAKLQTFKGERPAPLPPSPVLGLGSGMEPAGGGIVLPALIAYDALAAEPTKHFAAKPANSWIASDLPAGLQPHIKSLSFFPAGKRLAVGVTLSLPANGSWFPGQGVAYFLSTPAIKPGSPELVLTQCEPFGISTKQSARQKELPYLIDPRFADLIGGAVNHNIDDNLTAALDLLRQQQSVVLTKGLRLWVTPTQARVAKITPGPEGLALQIEVSVDLSSRRDGTDVASDNDNAKATP
jgi:hypothetical protein